MFKTKAELEKTVVSNLRGGKGDLDRFDIFTEEEMLGKARVCAILSLPPGASIGEHPHGPDAEIYFILTGTLRVTDDGVTRDVSVGDAVYTGGGKIHGVENVSDKEASMLAVVIN